MQAACYNHAMQTKTKALRKKTVAIRIDEATYKKLRQIAYRANMKIIQVMHEQFVSGMPVRKGT